MADLLKHPFVQKVQAKARAFGAALRTLPARARQWWSQARPRLAATFAVMGARLRALPAALRQPQAMAKAGIGAALVAMLVFAAIPRGPEAQTARQALSGRALFAALLEQQPGTARSSRVREGQDRGSGTNLIVLSESSWEQLSIDQRNSLGSWLDELGGRWEIRVGRATEDGTRVLDAAPVITHVLWNQQLK